MFSSDGADSTSGGSSCGGGGGSNVVKDGGRHQQGIAWVALDDEELLEGESNTKYRSAFEGHAVKINSRIGLTEDDAITAIKLLQQQLNGKAS